MKEYFDDPVTGRVYTYDDDNNLVEVPPHIADLEPGEAFFIAAGDVLNRAGRRIGGLLGFEPEQPTAGDREAMAQLREAHPVQTTLGEVAPALATAPLTGGSSLLGTMAFQGGLGAATGALFDEDAGSGAVLGAAGGAAGDVVGRVLARGYNALRGSREAFKPSKEAQQFVATGGRLTPGQASGEKSLDVFEGQIESDPFAGRLMDDIGEANQENVNQLAADALDMPSVRDLSGEGFDAAEESIERTFQQLAQDVGDVNLSGRQLAQVKAIAPDVKHMEHAPLNDALSKVGTDEAVRSLRVPADVAMGIRTELTSQLNTATSASKIQRIGRVMDDFDAMIARQASRPVADAYEAARKQYQFLQVLKSPGVVDGGNVSVKSLKGKLRRTYGQNYAGEMEKISPRMGVLGRHVEAATSRELTPQFGRTGTPERTGDILGRALRQPVYEWYMRSGGNMAGVLSGLTTPAAKINEGAARTIQRMTAGGGRAGLMQMND